MTELLDIVSNGIPESQKRVFKRFYQVRDKAKLALYEQLESKGALPPQLKQRLAELRQEQQAQ